MSAILGLETFYPKRMINDYIYLQYGRIINVMKICLISAHIGWISRVRVLNRPHLTMASLINTFTTLSRDGESLQRYSYSRG